MRGWSEHRLQPGRVKALGRRPGELYVLEGLVWLTLHGVENDIFLEPGKRLCLAAGHRAVVEAGGENSVAVAWRPLPSAAVALGVSGLRKIARFSLDLAEYLESFAREVPKPASAKLLR